ncbi:VOC family protein [Sphingopyxis sp. R3-92]|uniref:VOC family protein n=1 Tax=Sphingopyxis sp. R3-92 TaxID=3158553 RepID=UPI003EE58331
MGIKALGYVLVETAKPEAWDSYLTAVVGAMRTDNAPDGAAFYRIDDRPLRFWIQAGDAERLTAAAYEVSDATELAALRDRINRAGRPIQDGTVEEARLRAVAAFFRTTDPAGNGLEFFHGGARADSAFASPAGVTGFVTGEMGMGHVVFAAPNFDETHAFYVGIGFRDTDIARYRFSEDPGDPGMGFTFMHANNGRHHSLALGDIPQSPFGCVHVMLEMKTQADVGKCHDRMRQANIPESASIGRHVNDQTFGFYMQTPSGFDLEVGCDPLVIDPATWVPTAHGTPSEWGHVWAWQNAAENAG